MLNSRIYIGEITHKDLHFPGEHDGIIDKQTWTRAQKILEKNWRGRANDTRKSTPAMLKGIIRCGCCGCSMRPGWTKKKGKKYRYYVCINMDKHPKEICTVRRIGADTVEKMVLGQLRVLFQQPEVVARAGKMEEVKALGLTEKAVHQALGDLQGVWEYLFPAEQARLAQLVLDSVNVAPNGVEIQIKNQGLGFLMSELTISQPKSKERRAAS